MHYFKDTLVKMDDLEMVTLASVLSFNHTCIYGAWIPVRATLQDSMSVKCFPL